MTKQVGTLKVQAAIRLAAFARRAWAIARRSVRLLGYDRDDLKAFGRLIAGAVVVIGAAGTIGFAWRVFTWTSGFGGT